MAIGDYIKGEGKLPHLLREAADGIQLTENEFHCFCDANKDCGFTLSTWWEDFGTNVSGYAREPFSERWNVDLLALSEKLNRLTPIQKCALLAAMDGIHGLT